jgi:transcriptional regulator with XRE-family HTH domain
MEYRLLLSRLEADLTAGELADRMGVSRDVVSRVENGKSKPRRIVLNAWALATGVPVSWLRDGIGEMKPPPGGDSVRPKGLEPPTFCLGVAAHVISLFPNGENAEQDRVAS